jgi:hypothetical protein
MHPPATERFVEGTAAARLLNGVSMRGQRLLSLLIIIQ